MQEQSKLKQAMPSYKTNLFKSGMVLLIIISSITLVLSTEPKIYNRASAFFYWIECVSSIFFFLEYCYRIKQASSPQTLRIPYWRQRLSYIISFMGLIDLLSFLPFFLLLFKTTTDSFILILQLLRLVKLTRYFPAFHLLADVLRDEAESLIVSIVLMFIIVIFASVGIYAFEHQIQPNVFGSIPRAMWWAIVTLTTVGYGDVTPVTGAGKIFATFITIAGVGLVSLPAGIIASGFTEQLRMRRKHFELEVEQLIEDDGQLSQEDISLLEKDRKLLGLNKEKANFIISQVRQRKHKAK